MQVLACVHFCPEIFVFLVEQARLGCPCCIRAYLDGAFRLLSSNLGAPSLHPSSYCPDHNHAQGRGHCHHHHHHHHHRNCHYNHLNHLVIITTTTIIIIMVRKKMAMKYNGQPTDESPHRDESPGSNGINRHLITNSSLITNTNLMITSAVILIVTWSSFLIHWIGPRSEKVHKFKRFYWPTRIRPFRSHYFQSVFYLPLP